MPISAFAVLFFLFLASPSLLSAAELSVVSHPSKLRLPPGDPVEGSPGSRPGSITVCNRIHIQGLSRIRHLNKFAHALKIRVFVDKKGAIFRIQSIELCFHRNASIGLGMCPSTEWQKLSKDSWVQSVSPFGNRILDICVLPDPSRSIEVSTEQEFLFHRAIFLVIGVLMMLTAHLLSESVVFYYSSAMTIGIILVILMVLFQGMRLLPTGRKSSLGIFLYSSIVGMATFLLRYLSGLLRSILLEIGISEDMHNPLGLLLLGCLVLAGAWFGYWGVRKLVLTDDGLVDSDVAYFVEWAILIFAAVMILQSSLDTILATEAVFFAIVITTMIRTSGKLRIFRRFFKRLFKRLRRTRVQISPTRYSHAEYPYQFQSSGSELHRTQARHSKFTPCSSPVEGLTKRPQTSFEEESYYSTFHNTPERKRFTKDEWEAFTKEHTRKALRELVSSPDFNQWAVENAERICLTPPEIANRDKQRRLFRWF